MHRIIHNELKNWKISDNRKPLVLRGARQIGKTTCIRQFAKDFDSYVEINFEQMKQVHALFDGDLDPQKVLIDLQVLMKQQIIPGQTLLFFDELQSCPQALLSLRYFYELMPQLHLIAAGSLLEFAIETIGLPVGRVNFLYMYPMSFLEFLWALDEGRLVDAIVNQDPVVSCNNSIHEKALRLLGEYMAIGGMPEAVVNWRDHKNYQACLEIHYDLVAAYQQDFEKYAKRSQVKYLEHVLKQLPYQLGESLQYAKFSGNYRKRELSPAVELLQRANVITGVYDTPAQGLPLGAGIDPDNFKVIMLDVALTQALLGMTAEVWILDPQAAFVNKGALAEAFVGQELLAYGNPRQKQQLYYWRRNQRGSEAEVDYVIAKDNEIIPIEVKSGKGTTLKSMHSFLASHMSPYGIRFSTHNYSVYEKIHSYPLYATFKLKDQR